MLRRARFAPDGRRRRMAAPGRDCLQLPATRSLRPTSGAHWQPDWPMRPTPAKRLAALRCHPYSIDYTRGRAGDRCSTNNAALTCRNFHPEQRKHHGQARWPCGHCYRIEPGDRRGDCETFRPRRRQSSLRGENAERRRSSHACRVACGHGQENQGRRWPGDCSRGRRIERSGLPETGHGCSGCIRSGRYSGERCGAHLLQAHRGLQRQTLGQGICGQRACPLHAVTTRIARHDQAASRGHRQYFIRRGDRAGPHAVQGRPSRKWRHDVRRHQSGAGAVYARAGAGSCRAQHIRHRGITVAGGADGGHGLSQARHGHERPQRRAARADGESGSAAGERTGRQGERPCDLQPADTGRVRLAR